MDRLTKKLPDGTVVLKNNNAATITCATEKLSRYEDAEEQCLLIRLPCKVGDTVYSVSFKKKCAEMEENGGYLINQNMDCAFCENENCKSKEEFFIEEITATLPIIANIIRHKNNESDDFMIYLAREEAEKKLEEMEASENAERKD